IASGYATLGQVGFEHRREYTAIGSVINLASRLCGEAKSGQIVISQRVFGAVEQYVESSHIGQLSLKGFNRPIDAYEVMSWQPRSSAQNSSVATLPAGTPERGS
ncbi:MAG: adenylate/guanylate cyclase domain-containing protein, partial [Xanthobacteraceae bacterium]